MSKNDLRLRSGQLIVPFGIGQIVPNKEGLSLMIGGLNLWDKMIAQRARESESINSKEFELQDERLQKLLGVTKFIKPFPYYERSQENKKLKLPAVVFPQWHYCSYCKIMRKAGLTGLEQFNNEDEGKNKYNKKIQEHFNAIFDSEHKQND